MRGKKGGAPFLSVQLLPLPCLLNAKCPEPKHLLHKKEGKKERQTVSAIVVLAHTAHRAEFLNVLLPPFIMRLAVKRVDCFPFWPFSY